MTTVMRRQWISAPSVAAELVSTTTTPWATGVLGSRQIRQAREEDLEYRRQKGHPACRLEKALDRCRYGLETGIEVVHRPVEICLRGGQCGNSDAPDDPVAIEGHARGNAGDRCRHLSTEINEYIFKRHGIKSFSA
ncbi:hypothetical protein MTO96_044810 [Rhipicephalus appendiculatus]